MFRLLVHFKCASNAVNVCPEKDAVHV